jgi:DDE family transposase
MGAELVLEAAHLGIDLVGPVPIAGGRQEREHRGYALADFTIDRDTKTATCPQGTTSTRWIDTKIDGHPRIHVDFYNVGCPSCLAMKDCTNSRFRGLTLHPREEYQALQHRRAEQDTEPWRQRCAARAGVEGTIAQAVNACDARRTRYKGLPKVRVEHILLAAAINLIRLDAWWTGTPLGRPLTWLTNGKVWHESGAVQDERSANFRNQKLPKTRPGISRVDQLCAKVVKVTRPPSSGPLLTTPC